jgi:hypothetical protein
VYGTGFSTDCGVARLTKIRKPTAPEAEAETTARRLGTSTLPYRYRIGILTVTVNSQTAMLLDSWPVITGGHSALLKVLLTDTRLGKHGETKMLGSRH